MAEDLPLSPLSLCLFGPFEAHVDGHALPPLRSRKHQGLLALLALRHGREVQRAWIAGTLWPESAEEAAFHSLRQSLWDVRRALGSQAYRLSSPTTRTLCLDLSGAEVDVLAFDAAVAKGDRAALVHAVVLYRGPLLEGYFEEWVTLERGAREQAYLQARETLAEQALAVGETATAIGHLQQVIALDGLRESAHARLMEALAASGDYAAVVQVYRDLRLRLHRDLHAEPAAETTALFHRLRETGRRAVQPRPDRPQPLPSLQARDTHNLPPALTSFIGREQEVEEVQSLLSRSRLLTLIGAGGCGKTRLALQVAAEQWEEFAAGVWLVELAALSDPALVPQSVRTVLGVPEEAGRTATETLCGYLRSRQILLLLDNCEHLVAACAHLADTLLRSCPQLTILTTSREALQVAGEQPWRVPSMQHPVGEPASGDEKEFAAILLEYDACRLFVERARVQCPEFVLSGRNARAVAQLCQQLDGMPLAIELAAARMRSLTIEEITSRLDQRLRLLRGGSRTAPPRQQTLRALIDWSYDLLNEQEKALLRRLSVFAGGWTLAAAEQVGAGKSEAGEAIEEWEVLDLLTSLVDKSLVNAETQGEAARYRLLETVRQYAHDRLVEIDEVLLVRARHRDYFLALAEEARPKLQGVEQAQWLGVLEEEHDNLRQALTFCLEEPEGGEAGLRLGGALQQFWWTRGHLSEGRQHLSAVLSRPFGQDQRTAHADALNGAANLARMQGDYVVARALHEESVTMMRELGNKRGIAGSLNNLGIVAKQQGDYAAARALYEESLTIYRELGDKQGIGNSLGNLGIVAHEQSDYAAARALYEECLTLFRELGDKRGIGNSLNNLGSVAQEQGDYAAARALHEECLTLLWEFGDKRGIANSLNNLGIVAKRQGDYAAARALYEESLALFRELGDKQGIGNSLGNLGIVAQEQGDYAAARALHEESLPIHRELGDKQGIGNSLNNLGGVAQEQGDYAAARALYEESLTLLRELGDKQGIANSLDAHAFLAHQEHHAQRAARLWGASTSSREAIGSPRPLHEREKYDIEVAQARSALGESAFVTAWEEGHAMTWEAAVAMALGETQE